MNLQLTKLIEDHKRNVAKYSVYRNRKRRGFAKSKSSRRDCPTIPRERKTVFQNYRALGPVYFRRAYRMTYFTFRKLFDKIKYSLHEHVFKTEDKNCPNGRIPLCSRLGIALRFFAGGDPYDIITSYGVSHTSIFVSIDAVVDTLNSMEEFKIEYPSNHEVQRQIAQGFKQKSEVGFECCAGAIDGMLVWMHKPSKKDCADSKVDESKWHCSRKHRYGLNMQAICDSRKRFLDLSIMFGGASSDLVAFEASVIRQKLEDPNFLAEGLVLFGDNAYLNSAFMATPYVKSHSGFDAHHDNYNFFHSQLRINIECAFGILCQRWGFLRKPAPKKYTVQKTIATVSCLCRLHNFLIDQDTNYGTAMLEPTDADACSVSIEGGVDIVERRDGHPMVPRDLSGGGEHFDDDSDRSIRRRTAYQTRMYGTELPRDSLMNHVLDTGKERPK